MYGAVVTGYTAADMRELQRKAREWHAKLDARVLAHLTDTHRWLTTQQIADAVQEDRIWVYQSLYQLRKVGKVAHDITTDYDDIWHFDNAA
jgi:hypothetical protein